MSTQHATRIKLAPWALLLVAASWGWAFVIMKESIARQSVNNFLFSRFALAVIVMVLIRPQVFRFFDKDLVTRSAFAGTFLGAGYILQTLGLERTGARDAYAMTVVQLATCTLITGLASVAEGGYSPPPDWGVWATVVFTAVVCTAAAFMIQTWSQAHMSTTKVAVILTMEVVFAAVFAILFGGESLTLQTAVGGILVVIAMYVIVIKET